MSTRAAYHFKVARVLLRSGIARTPGPIKGIRTLAVIRRCGMTLATGCRIGAIRYPNRAAVIDEDGIVTYGELEAHTNALANALARQGLGEGDGIAIMCRNHRGFVFATLACAKLGAHALYLNTEFSAPAIASVLQREGTAGLIYDEEFAGLVAPGSAALKRFVAYHDPGTEPAETSVAELIASGDSSPPPRPARRGRVVILTSGTTGTPKGAMRKPPESVEPAAAVLSTIPLRARQTTMLAAPLFHSWGFAQFLLGLPLTSTFVLLRRFDPERTLGAIQEHRASTLVVVPVMLQRMLELPAETLDRYDSSSLRVIASSGSPLPGALANRVMDRFGSVLYNLYGSTEVAWVTIATPDDLRAAPGTAGRPPLGTTVRLLDDTGREVPRGERGRIFAANSIVFEGYTDGSGKEVLAGVTHTGDVGHFDERGRLFVDGRDDEMIISGGENVYPREVEDLLVGHDEIEEAAVVGVEDGDFGQRLLAFVVPRNGAELNAAEIKAFVRANLARYKVPRDVVFLSQLPRNASGKVLKRELTAVE